MGQTAANTDIFYATTTPAVVANGAPNHGNTYLLDGISLDDSPSGGDAKLVSNPDSVQEVVVTTTTIRPSSAKPPAWSHRSRARRAPISYMAAYSSSIRAANGRLETNFRTTTIP